jgi:hypothetical protein
MILSEHLETDGISACSSHLEDRPGIRCRCMPAVRGVGSVLEPVWIQDSHPCLFVIQAWDGPIRFD